MDGWSGKMVLNWMIWGSPRFWKPRFIDSSPAANRKTRDFSSKHVDNWKLCGKSCKPSGRVEICQHEDAINKVSLDGIWTINGVVAGRQQSMETKRHKVTETPQELVEMSEKFRSFFLFQLSIIFPDTSRMKTMEHVQHYLSMLLNNTFQKRCPRLSLAAESPSEVSQSRATPFVIHFRLGCSSSYWGSPMTMESPGDPPSIHRVLQDGNLQAAGFVNTAGEPLGWWCPSSLAGL